MPKVYGIIRGNGDILVGKGGKSGPQKRMRTGLHLPGGSINGNENFITAVIREIMEETGVYLKQQDIIDDFKLILNGQEVYFVIFEVFSVRDTIIQSTRPPITNAFDEPFLSLESLEFSQCINNDNFSAKHNTDWFAKGLLHASNNKML